MRVVHVTPALFGADGGIVGGAERYVLELARHMADEVPTKLVTFGDKARRERIGNLDVRVIGSPWHVRGQRTNPVSLRLIPELMSADVVHCHQQHVVASSLSALVARLSGRRVFVTDLGGGGWDISGYVSTDRWYHAHLHISRYSRRIYGHADAAWAHEIFGGVDTQRFSPDPGVERGDAALFVGRLLAHKGVDYLVEAASADQPVDVIGQPYDATFVETLHRLAEGKSVSFHHGFDDAALVRAYRSALCVVLPSVYRARDGSETVVPELLGQTLLEGMACGAPVICTDVASMPEIVQDGITGFVVPPNDAAALSDRLRWLREHPAEAAAMGVAARERVLERFTWSAVVQACVSIYGDRGTVSQPTGDRRSATESATRPVLI